MENEITNNELENEVIETNTGGSKDEQSGSKDDQSGSKDVKTDKDPKKEIMIPKSRFDEVNEKAKAIEAEIAEIKAQTEAGSNEGVNVSDDDQSEADEEFSAKQAELNEMNQQIEAEQSELENLQAREAELMTAIDSIVASRMDTIPEDFRELVPDTDSLSQIAWIQKAEAKGLFEPIPDRSKESLGRKTNAGKAVIQDIAQAVGGSLGMISAGYREQSRRY